ncbi:cytoskeletal protein [Saccharomyces pastorianus]|uniref:Cytoskeletal protein n=1 Tax=Saccharomyces pastorianus TaxID=27292 RepID=A0A6C1E296_SACPS|nr:cytoskeletal protein [Saccharomyces pastorianus]
MERPYLSGQEDQYISERLIPRSNSTSNLFSLSSTFSKLNVRNDAEYNSFGPNKKRQINRCGNGQEHMTRTNNFPMRSSSMTAAQRNNKGALFTVKGRNSYHEGLNKDHYYQDQCQNTPNSVRMYKKLTPYQMQRSKMKTSFQFPNGEVFKPKPEGRNSTSSKKISLSSKNPFSFRFGQKEGSASLENLPAKVSSAPNMETFQDTDSLNSDSSVPSTTKSSIASSSPISTVNTPTSCTESHTDDDDGFENKTVTISYSFQNAVTETHNSHIEKLNMLNEKEAKLPTKPGPRERKNKANSGYRRNECKKSSSRLNLGSVLKKLWSSSGKSNTKPNKKYPKKKLDPDDDIADHFVELPDMENDIELMNATLNSIEIDDDETLMDANSIFDDLLSKENSKCDSRQKQLEIRQKLHETAPNDHTDTFHRNLKEKSINDALFDKTIIEDFSKLGEYIIDTRNQPPPRSTKRPSLDNNESARHFYSMPTDSRQPLFGTISSPMDIGNDIIDRLRNDWEYIRFDDCGNSPPKSSSSNVEAVSKPSKKKGVRFAEEVCLASTWSPNVYERANPEFIMNRHRLLWMMKVNPSMNKAMNEVKLELNYFKRNEMVVHKNSKCFTHYLI